MASVSEMQRRLNDNTLRKMINVQSEHPKDTEEVAFRTYNYLWVVTTLNVMRYSSARIAESSEEESSEEESSEEESSEEDSSEEERSDGGSEPFSDSEDIMPQPEIM